MIVVVIIGILAVLFFLCRHRIKRKLCPEKVMYVKQNLKNDASDFMTKKECGFMTEDGINISGLNAVYK